MMKILKKCRTFRGLIGIVVFVALASVAIGNTGDERKPNILFIWTDQQIFGMLSCEGNRHIETPNLDRLASEGAMLNNTFCTLPSCSPSRATVVSGLYAHRHRLYDNVHPEKGLEGITPMDGFKITQQYLHEAGYAVGHRGKWHAGKKADWGPCFTAESNFSEKYSPLWDQKYKAKFENEFPWDKKRRTGNGGYVKGKLPLPIRQTPSWQTAFETGKVNDWAVVGETLAKPEEIFEYGIIEDAIEFVERHKDGPWMATVSLSPPHDPWDVPEPYYSQIVKPLVKKMEILGSSIEAEQRSSLSWRVGQLVDDQGIRDYIAIYHAQVVMMDEFIGRVLDKLDEWKLTDNTLVLFTSDHGDMVGMHRNVGKINNNLYNRLYHVPGLIRYPAAIKGGQVIDKPVMLTDVMPTFLDYAGIDPPKNIDGRSLRPLIEGANVEWRDYHLLEKFMNTTRNPDHSVKNKEDFYWVMGVEDGRYKYLCPRFNDNFHNKKYSPPRFIDLKNDPLEENNLFESSQHRKLVSKYHEKLRQILNESHFEFMDEFPDDPWIERAPRKM